MHAHRQIAPALVSVLAPLALVLLALLGLDRGLWTPDEPREAEISREMALAPGVVPTLNGRRFIEKPPLYYWTVAAVFRLSGGATALAARSVSAAAALATLALLVAWGASAHSRAAGWLAALMLATSAQFVVSTHWVLLDPLLMLATTAAAWTAWELLAGRDRTALRVLFYVALVAALWIKGLIGPVLVGAGLIAVLLSERPAHWRRLRPFIGGVVLLLAVAGLAGAIWRQGGRDALWEWAYVNHVQRLTDPGITGHRQPLLYYAWTLPYAVLPWLPALLQGLRPAHWGRAPETRRGAPDPARYGAVLSAGMLVLLSISATKRETYLLPLLPPLFLWIGIRSLEWWRAWCAREVRGVGALWWLQALLLCLYAVAAPVAAWIWRGRLSAAVLAGLLLASLPAAALVLFSARGDRRRAGPAALACAVTGVGVLLSLAPGMLDPVKDMGPFVRWVGTQLPVGAGVYATGVDETLEADIPFYTGRRLVALPPGSGQRPDWWLIQDRHEGVSSDPGPDYERVGERAFGAGRSLALWRRRPGANPR